MVDGVSEAVDREERAPADVSVRAMAAILPLSGYSTISGVPCDAAMTYRATSLERLLT